MSFRIILLLPKKCDAAVWFEWNKDTCMWYVKGAVGLTVL